MATITFGKTDDYLKALGKLESDLREQVMGPAVYEAAGTVADAFAEELAKIPTDEHWGTDQKNKKGPRPSEKKAMQDQLGITKAFEQDGFYGVKIGFDGYTDFKTRKYPKGQPIMMIAHSVERGTSFMAATPFAKNAMARSKKPAVQKMGEKVDEGLKKIMEGDQ